MALITISGYPSSGKTSRAQQLKAFLETQLRDPSYTGPQYIVVLISDDTLGLSRSAYDESRTEKPARSALFTAMQRQLRTDTILIMDSLNYIKGFRYQMYCAAREAKVRVCTIFVAATHDLCREWNANRQDGCSYIPSTLENLLVRYEEPSSMVRWDSPLFTVPWTDEDIPGPQIWGAITKENIKPPNSGTLSVTKTPVDALHSLEQTTTSMVSAIFSENTSLQGSGGQVTIQISETCKPQITLPPRNITLSELQRLKRQFVTVHKKLITLGTTEKGNVDWGEDNIAAKFVRYLEENFK